MKSIVKKGSAIALAVMLTLPGLALNKAHAANVIDTEQKCTLTIALEDYEYVPDSDQMEIPISLYKVADIDANGSFKSVGAFSELDFSALRGNATAQSWVTLAEQAFSCVGNMGATKESVIKTDEGSTIAKVAINDLEVGLYLVVPQETYNPDYSYKFSFTPYLTILPTGGYTASEDGSDGAKWNYNPSIGLKPAIEEQYGKLTITKHLTNYNVSLGQVTFVFEIEGVNAKGETIYSNIVTTTHTAAGNETVTLENIPAGTIMTVKEVYSGASYTISGEEVKEGVVINSERAIDEGAEEASVTFTNKYDGGTKSGYGVNNHFESDGEGGWIWMNPAQNVQ